MSQEKTVNILADLAAGDSSAASKLFSLVYDELRAVADGYFKRQPADHTLQPTALVHEAFLRLVGGHAVQCENRAHFLAVAAKAMRQILISHARKRSAAKRGGECRTLTLVENLTPVAGREIELIALDDALNELSKLNERVAQVVELRFFGGLTVEEVARYRGVSKRTVESDWEMARAWLSRELSEGEQK